MESDMLFENEVRRIARLLWPSAEFSGSENVDGKERDGVFETEECIHLIEVTTSKGKDKARDDINKLIKLAQSLRTKNQSKAIKCWFITKDEPTSDQRGTIPKQHGDLVNAMSFSQFQSRLIDSHAYISARNKYRFGSVRDLNTETNNPSKIKYVPLDMVNIASKDIKSIGDIIEGLKSGSKYIILGDYGAGKSMTLRKLYQELQKEHLQGKTPTFPVYINLYDHYGQKDPAEVLERHAKKIGFAYPSHLVRAWRAGFVILLIDGFDEVATIAIQGLMRGSLGDNRYRAMEIVRNFVREHPSGHGIIMAGREHFFNSPVERHKALGIIGQFTELSLNEFSDEQVTHYLGNYNLSGKIPSWVPSRPLLIGYLVSKGIMSEITSRQKNNTEHLDLVDGWDYLLERISQRESEIEPGIDGKTIRMIIERLSTKARKLQDGLGPLNTDEVIKSFKEVCGYDPDERGMVLIQRLPGIGVYREDENTRSFIDQDFADACRAGDIVRFVTELHGFTADVFHGIECVTDSLGISMASRKLLSLGVTAKQLNASIDLALIKCNENAILADIARIALENDYEITQNIFVKGVMIPELDLTKKTSNHSRVSFEDCIFTRIGIDNDVRDDYLPRFRRCYIGEIEGRTSVTDLPSGIFDSKCEIRQYPHGMETTNTILNLSVPLGEKVLLTILKKLYMQRGHGRKTSALHRGLDHNGQRLVPSILKLLESEGLAHPYRGGDVWLPERTSMKRVGKILSSPTSNDDIIIERTRRIT